MAAEPQRLLIDATTLIGEGYGTSRRFRLLLDAAKRGEVEVVVPDIVVREAAMVAGRTMRREAKVLRAVATVLRGLDHQLPDIRQVTERMDAGLRERLDVDGVIVDRDNSISAEGIADRVLAGRRPTSPQLLRAQPDETSTESFRDQLIWAYVLREAQSGPLAFISNNVTDFAHDKNPPNQYELHEDLLADLAAQGVAGTVTAYRNLAAYMSSVLSHVELRDRAERALDGAWDLFSTELVALLDDRRPIPVSHYLPPVPPDNGVDEALLGEDVSLSREDATVLEIYVEDGDAVDVIFDVMARADVSWFSGHLTGWDIARYGARVEALDAGGMIDGLESDEPILIHLGATLQADGTWQHPEVLTVELDPEVAKRRDDERHTAALVQQYPSLAQALEVPAWMTPPVRRPPP